MVVSPNNILFSSKCSKCRSIRIVETRKEGVGLKEKIFSLSVPYIRKCLECGHSEEIKKLPKDIIKY